MTYISTRYIRILCSSYSVARNMLNKTTEWLSKRLQLEVNEEKTRIINIKKNAMNFLGCNIKVRTKDNKSKIISHIEHDRLKRCEKNVKEQTRKIKRYKSNKTRCEEEINRYNYIVMGIHNYYDMNNMIYEDLIHIDKITRKYIYKNLSDVLTFSNKVIEDDFITKKYGNGKNLPYIRGKPIIPIGRITYRVRNFKSESVNYFDKNSRIKIHKTLKIDNLYILYQIVKTPMLLESVELNDIVISKFCGNMGKYSITNNMIVNYLNFHVIKINNKKAYKYDNILLLENKIKKLIELKEVDDMIEISKLTRGLTREQLDKINNIRKENSLSLISY